MFLCWTFSKHYLLCFVCPWLLSHSLLTHLHDFNFEVSHIYINKPPTQISCLSFRLARFISLLLCARHHDSTGFQRQMKLGQARLLQKKLYYNGILLFTYNHIARPFFPFLASQIPQYLFLTIFTTPQHPEFIHGYLLLLQLHKFPGVPPSSRSLETLHGVDFQIFSYSSDLSLKLQMWTPICQLVISTWMP